MFLTHILSFAFGFRMASIFFGSRNAIQIKNEVFRGTIGFLTPSRIFCETARGNVTLPYVPTESPPSGGDLNRQRCKKPTQMSFEKIENGENEEWDFLEKKEMDELFLHEKTSFTFPNFSIIYLLI